MNPVRRTFLKMAGGLGTLVIGTAAGLLGSTRVWAANWNKPAFESKEVAGALKNIGAANLIESKDIVITAPDIAENGAVVPLAASFDITGGMEGYVSTRIKMGKTANVRAVVKADGKFYTAAKEIKITIGGCG